MVKDLNIKIFHYLLVKKANILNKFIENNIKQNKNIKFIVHCHQGASRSFAIGTYITKINN